MDQAKRGADALAAGDFAAAIAEYTAALHISPTSPDYHIKRSTAYQRTTPPDHARALADADNAVVFAQKRAKRELIIQAQLRRAIALFGLQRYADAQFVFDVVKRMDPKEKSLAIWEAKLRSKLDGLPADAAGAKFVVTEIPSLEPVPASIGTAAEAPAQSGGSPAVLNTASPITPVQTPPAKIKHDWYQNNDSVFFTLLAKGVPKDRAKVHIQPQSLSIIFPTSTGSDFEFNLDPLFDEIDVSQSSHSILSTKVEVVLRKKQPGRKWHALESTEPISATEDTAKPNTLVANPGNLKPTTQPPAYPTSSRSGPKNWDKIVDDITTTKKDTPSESQNDDDNYDYDKEGGDDVNAFFKKLYAGATDDQKKAMMKSFVESNGTALSTNWADVKKAKVETQPPDGMEAKQWEA